MTPYLTGILLTLAGGFALVIDARVGWALVLAAGILMLLQARGLL